MSIVKRILVLSVIAGMLALSGFAATGATWQPFDFEGNERYRYRVLWNDGDEQSAIYELGIEEDAEGNFKVSYSTEVTISPNELSEQLVFGFWGGYGPSLSFLFLNPMYEMLFSQLELTVGEKMSYYGQGKMEVVSMETIAGLEGYVCKFYESDDELVAEWVINPGMALPLRSRMYEGSGLEGEIELLNYEKL